MMDMATIQMELMLTFAREQVRVKGDMSMKTGGELPKETPTTRAAEVAFTVATYGINVPGTVYRMDDVPISLRPALECHHPSDLEILKGIEKQVQKLNMKNAIAQSKNESLRPARDEFGSSE